MTVSIGRAFVNEAGAEILKHMRAPEYLVPTLILPVAFYTLSRWQFLAARIARLICWQPSVSSR